MHLQVPYYSQHKDVKDDKWRKHSCAIVCVFMVLSYMKSLKKEDKIDLPSIDNLIYEGFEMRGTGEFGWTHDSLVWLFHNHGVLAYREEFKSADENLQSDFFEAGIEKLVSSLKNGHPVIVSGIKKWKEEKKFHTFVLVGYEEKNSKLSGFYYHDSDDESQDSGENLFVDIDTFKHKWRRLAVFVYH